MTGPQLEERKDPPVEEPREEKRVEWINIGPTKRSAWATAAVVMIFSILFHIAVYYTIPRNFLVVYPRDSKDQQKLQQQKNRYVNVHLMPYAKPPEKKQDQYVQATNAPEKKPDFTNNFSSKNQQASQIVKSKDNTGDTPEVEKGEKEESNALETGAGKHGPTIAEIADSRKADQSDNDTNQPQNRDYQKKQDPKQAEGKTGQEYKEAAPIIPNAFEEKKPEDLKGKGYAEVQKTGENPKMPDKAPEEREIPAVVTNPLVQMELPKAEASAASGMRPKPRPRINLSSAMPTILKKTMNGLSTPSGNIAFDSKLNEYGTYLDRMYEAIGSKWHELNNSSPPSIENAESLVRIKYYINKKGEVEDLTVVETNATQSAQWRCIDAIKSNSPYEPWTAEMIKTMGNRQDIMVVFYYR